MSGMPHAANEPRTRVIIVTPVGPEGMGGIDRLYYYMREHMSVAGDAALDTALYDGLGGLRVEVILPSAGLKVTGSGVLWPPEDDPLAGTLPLASRHRPLWVDIALP